MAYFVLEKPISILFLIYSTCSLTEQLILLLVLGENNKSYSLSE